MPPAAARLGPPRPHFCLGPEAPSQVSASHFRSTPSTDIIRPVRVVRLVQEAKTARTANANRASGKATFPASPTTMENNPTGKSAKTCPAPLAKIFRLTRRANHHYKLAPSHPDEGRIARRHERAVGCDGRDSVGRATGSQGGSCRERSDGARTDDAANRLCQNSPDGTRSGKTFGMDGRGRRSRVVLAPRCWRQVLRKMHPAQPGSGWIVNPQRRRWQTSRSPGRARSKP